MYLVKIKNLTLEVRAVNRRSAVTQAKYILKQYPTLEKMMKESPVETNKHLSSWGVSVVEWENNMTEATPRPKLRFDKDNYGRSFNDGYGLRAVPEDEGSFMEPPCHIFIEADKGDWEQAEVDAADVVKRWNAHAPMLAALARLRKALERIKKARIKFDGPIPSFHDARAWEIATHELTSRIRDITKAALAPEGDSDER